MSELKYQIGPFDGIQHAVGIHNQGSRAVPFLQGMAGDVETILDGMDHVLAHHRRCGYHGEQYPSGGVQDVGSNRSVHNDLEGDELM